MEWWGTIHLNFHLVFTYMHTDTYMQMWITIGMPHSCTQWYLGKFPTPKEASPVHCQSSWSWACHRLCDQLLLHSTLHCRSIFVPGKNFEPVDVHPVFHNHRSFPHSACGPLWCFVPYLQWRTHAACKRRSRLALLWRYSPGQLSSRICRTSASPILIFGWTHPTTRIHHQDCWDWSSAFWWR